MRLENRDRLLRRAWNLPPLGDNVGTISEIAQAIGPAPRSRPPTPPGLPYTLRSLAAAAHHVSRAQGGGGTTHPGQVVLSRAPNALRALSRRQSECCILVSGTNGKTTTASMLAAILREAGHAVTHNRAGANVPAGVVTALLEEPSDYGVFEVDEAWLPVVAAELTPDLVVLANLFRDRLDGYGELDALADAWEAMVRGGLRARLVLNADDPTVAALGSAGAEGHVGAVSYFGIEDREVGLPDSEHAVDSARCRGCDGPLHYETRILSHMGHHRCDSCGTARPLPLVAAEEIRIDGLSGSRFTIGVSGDRLDARLELPGLYNVYNALAAAAAAHALGIGPGPITSALAAFEPVFGRGERVRAGSTNLVVLLMKNPAGANELLRALAGDASPPLDLLIALNDGQADGRDVSWIWDADFEALGPLVGRVVCSGRRAAELALRLKYAEWPLSRLEVEPEMPAALDLAIERSGDRVIALPTYSALLELHAELAGRGLVRPFWAGASAPVGSGQAA